MWWRKEKRVLHVGKTQTLIRKPESGHCWVKGWRYHRENDFSVRSWLSPCFSRVCVHGFSFVVCAPSLA